MSDEEKNYINLDKKGGVFLEFLIETKRLQSIFRAIGVDGLAEEAEIIFTPNELRAVSISRDNVVISKVVFSKKFFIEYDIPQEVKISLEPERIENVVSKMKELKAKFTIDRDFIYIESEKQRRGIRLITPSLHTTSKFTPKFATAVFGDIVMREDWDKDKVINSYCHAKLPVLTASELNPLGLDKLFLEVRGNRMYLIQLDEDETFSEDEITTNVVNPYDCRVMVNQDYLKSAIRSVISGEMYLAIGRLTDQPLPIVISDKTSDYKISIDIAPMIDIEEE